MDLSKGLYVENHGFLIPWGISQEEAWKIGNPVPTSLSEDRSRITWKDCVCLNGFKGDICVWFEKPKLYRILVVYKNSATEAGQTKEMALHGDKIWGPRNSNKYQWAIDNIEICVCADERFVTAYWYEIINRRFTK